MKNIVLPIGTVVSVGEEENIKFMIVGYFPVNEKGEKRDYSAVRYPMGAYDSKMFFFFDDVAITKIHHNGYEDENFIALSELIAREETLFEISPDK